MLRHELSPKGRSRTRSDIGPRNVREERVVEAIVHRNRADTGAPRDHGVGNRAWKLRDAISSRVAIEARSEAIVQRDDADAGALRGHGVEIEAWKQRSARPARKQARSGTIVQRDEAGAGVPRDQGARVEAWKLRAAGSARKEPLQTLSPVTKNMSASHHPRDSIPRHPRSCCLQLRPGTKFDWRTSQPRRHKYTR